MSELHFDTVDELKKWVIEHPKSDTRYGPRWHITREDFEIWNSYSWHSSRVSFSKELQEQLYDVWPKNPSYKGSDNLVPKGARTLKGVLKLLGVDVTKEVKAEIDKQNKLNNLISRNNLRKHTLKDIENIKEKLAKMREYGADIPEDVFDTSELSKYLELEPES